MLKPPPFGELAALSAALIWAGAAIVYQGIGKQIPPLILNFVKGGMAIGFLLITLVLRGQSLPAIAWSNVGLLALSGIIGIGIGDTAYFATLNCLGPRRTLLLETLAPSLAAGLAFLYLNESLSSTALWGIGLTLTGVIWVVAERVPVSQTQFRPWQGLGFGLIAALGQAGGAVLSRSALLTTDIDPLWSALIRIGAGTLVILPGTLRSRQSRHYFGMMRTARLVTLIAGTAFFSTYLGIWLQQISLKYAATGIAQALSSTSPLFVIPIVLLRGESVSLRALLGAGIALGGIWVLLNAT